MRAAISPHAGCNLFVVHPSIHEAALWLQGMSKQWCVCVCARGFHFLSFKLDSSWLKMSTFCMLRVFLLWCKVTLRSACGNFARTLFSVKVVHESHFVESLNAVAEADDMVHLIG